MPTILLPAFTARAAALAACLAGIAAALPARATDTALQQAIARGSEHFQHEGFGGNGRVCESCHVGGGMQAGHRPDGAPMPSLANAATVFPRMARDGKGVVTLADQVRNCVGGAIEGKVPAYGSDELNALVLYVTSLSQGKPIELGGQPR